MNHHSLPGPDREEPKRTRQKIRDADWSSSRSNCILATHLHTIQYTAWLQRVREREGAHGAPIIHVSPHPHTTTTSSTTTIICTAGNRPIAFGLNPIAFDSSSTTPSPFEGRRETMMCHINKKETACFFYHLLRCLTHWLLTWGMGATGNAHHTPSLNSLHLPSC